MILGIISFAPFLPWLLIKQKGDIEQILIGNQKVT